MNTCYKHFYYFVSEFSLVDKKELEPLVCIHFVVLSDVQNTSQSRSLELFLSHLGLVSLLTMSHFIFNSMPDVSQGLENRIILFLS